MSVNKETIHKIAHLARLELDDAKEEQMAKELSNILEWMETLNQVNTDNVKPLTHMSAEINVLRKDEVKEGLSHKEALHNAPKKDSDYFRVPKVLE
jgi:aspartyl-tRNA(Asn)/glutamyl-tRNA(Gln) amidotransferase subunit C